MSLQSTSFIDLILMMSNICSQVQPGTIAVPWLQLHWTRFVNMHHQGVHGQQGYLRARGHWKNRSQVVSECGWTSSIKIMYG